MITTTFTQIYPNQPWDPSVSDGNSVTVTWKGIRYHTFSRVTATGAVFGIEDSNDNLDELTNELPGQVHEGHTFHILDALKDPHVAAFLFGDDTIPAKDASGGIADYVFNTPNDDEDYVYGYNTENFVNQQYDGGSPLLYNISGNSFTMPGFLDHPVDKAQLFDGYESDAARVDAAVADRADEYTADEITALKAHSVWLKGVRARYASIEAWKVPYPTLGIPY
jgi:hypothetical protein